MSPENGYGTNVPDVLGCPRQRLLLFESLMRSGRVVTVVVLGHEARLDQTYNQNARSTGTRCGRFLFRRKMASLLPYRAVLGDEARPRSEAGAERGDRCQEVEHDRKLTEIVATVIGESAMSVR
jgi:hypothetical protein